jgi:hypothetical protein
LYDDEPQLDGSRKSRWGCVGFLSLVAIGLGLWGYFAFNPRDRIRVTFRNVPPGTTFLSIIAETDGLASNMNWSPQLILPFEMAPGRCTWSRRFPDNGHEDETHYFVMWIEGARYGLVTRNTDKQWSVTWFGAAAVPLEGRIFLLGGGRATFDMVRGKTEAFPLGKVEALGLDEVQQD